LRKARADREERGKNVKNDEGREERPGAVTMHGDPLTLLGKPLSVGDAAPDATLVNTELKEVSLASYRGKKLLVSSVPSIDTSVCDRQTRRFNEEAAAVSAAAIVTVSMDLPFAQARWCGAAGIERLDMLSDHRDAAFGLAWGLLIKELRLLGRAVFVVDAGGTVRYAELVEEISEEPDYAAALEALRALD
jgi:thiol peroxidase